MVKKSNAVSQDISTEDVLTELIRYNVPYGYCLDAVDQVKNYMAKNECSLDDAMLFIVQWASRKEYFDGLG